MCGIGCIVSGIIRLECSKCNVCGKCDNTDSFQATFCLKSHVPEDSNLKEGNKNWPSFDILAIALSRRGPDSLGAFEVTADDSPHIAHLSTNSEEVELDSRTKFDFIGATLHMRGSNMVTQPFRDDHGNVLLFNGEVFGGAEVLPDENDGQVLMRLLSNVQGDEGVPKVLSRLRGPWAVIYWQSSLSTLWFGRDAVGRRSLLVHRPTTEDPRFILSSTSPDPTPGTPPNALFSFWQEVPPGLHSLSPTPHIAGTERPWLHRKHPWEDPALHCLSSWQRVEPTALGEQSAHDEGNRSSLGASAVRLLEALSDSVQTRVAHCQDPSGAAASSCPPCPLGILFSGGLDSMLLAVLADRHLLPSVPIDLLNVSFGGESAPDRVTGRAGLVELQQISPHRRWRFIAVDASLSQVEDHREHIQALICPSGTHMDLNIGAALWLASKGEGLSEAVQCRSACRVLLVGTGADELCGGYARYRTRFRDGGWQALQDEMQEDVRRLWRRNLGRDDRCISDWGREPRFPFLDEAVLSLLVALPIGDVVDLSQAAGVGDKLILRQIARHLGVVGAASLPKRAIQFGSRIAGESNRKNFGSNRAANQASAGSLALSGLP